MKLNEKLKRLREEKGLSQNELAVELNVARQTISKWELGIREPDLVTIKSICRFFNCSLSELVDDDHETIREDELKLKNTKRTLFIFGSIIAFVMAVIFIVAGIVFIIMSSPNLKYIITDGLNSGTIQTSFKGNIDNQASSIQSMFKIMGIVFCCLGGMAFVSGTFGILSKDKENKTLLIINMIFGLLSFGFINLIAGVIGLKIIYERIE